MNSVRPPKIEKNQNDIGITLSRRFSEAIHWTRNRMEKKAWPRNPIDSQTCSLLIARPLVSLLSSVPRPSLDPAENLRNEVSRQVTSPG